MIKQHYRAIALLVTAVVALLLTVNAYAQQRLSGKVFDQSGAPVIGAAIMVQGTNNGAITDADGSYSLANVPSDGKVEISCLGYKNQVVNVQGKTHIDFYLEDDTEMMEETVVIGYAVQKKSDVTGAVSSLKGSELDTRSTENIGQALQGKAAGVMILSSSGAPGSEISIRVRGYSSNSSGSQDPLYVVDGMKVSSIDYIDTHNVESIEILKDAASAAIYGAEAGNGVVLITTKQGKKGEGRVTFDASYGITAPGHTAEVMNAQDYFDFQTAGGRGSGVAGWDHKTDTNWADQVYDKGSFSRYTVGFQGGNDRGNYFASISSMNNDGMIVGNKDYMNRISVQLNGSYKIKKWLEVQSNISINRSKRGSVSEYSDQGSNIAGAGMYMDPLTPIEVDGTNPFITEYMNGYINEGRPLLRNEATGNLWAISPFQEDFINPFIALNRTDAYNKNNQLRGTLAVNLTPFKGFTFTSRLGYTTSAGESYSYSSPYFGNVVTSSTELSLSTSVSSSSSIQWENFANYNFKLGNNNFVAMAGMSYRENNSLSVGGSVNHLTNEELENYRYLPYVSSDATKTISGGSPGYSAQISYFGRLTWSYKNRYNAQVNFRADAFDTSKLDKKSRWGYFPSASLGWTVSNEEFFKNAINKDTFSFLKFRVSYGKNGNVNVLSGYPYSTTVSVSSSTLYPIDGQYISGTTTSTRLPNKDLKWETAVQLDLGLETRFFRDRLSLNLDYYDKRTENLLVSTTPPAITGASSVYRNLGQVKNRGVELELGWKDTIGDFSYNISGNIATLTNKVTDLAGLSRQAGSNIHLTTATYFEEGYPVWFYYGYNYLGIDSKGEAIYEDRNNDGTISTDDKGYMGDAIPDFTYGLTINASYKNFDFILLGTGVQGQDLWYVANRPQKNTLSTFWKDSYSVKGTDAKYPAPNFNSWDYFAFSSASIFDGSYFKIKQIQLGYSLPKKLLEKTFISSVRAFVSLENYFTFTKYPGADPEIRQGGSSMGLDKGGYPISKNTMFGINVAF